MCVSQQSEECLQKNSESIIISQPNIKNNNRQFFCFLLVLSVRVIFITHNISRVVERRSKKKYLNKNKKNVENIDGEAHQAGTPVQCEQTRSHEIVCGVGSGQDAIRLYTKVSFVVVFFSSCKIYIRQCFATVNSQPCSVAEWL